MPAPTKTFDSSKIVCTFHGLPITGYADGTFVSVERDSASFTKTVGADGEVARAASPDKSGTIKFTLLQTSQSNDLLSAELEADEASGNNVKPVQIKDLFGRTLITGAEAWLERPAPVSFSKEVEAREWTIHVAALTMHEGGTT